MGTATLQTAPAPARAEPARRPRLRLPTAGGSTPDTLRIALAAVLLLALLAALLGTVAAARAHSGTRQLSTTDEPLLEAASSLYTALANTDANSTRAYLLAGQESAGSLEQFAAYENVAARELAIASALVGEAGRPGAAVRELSSGLTTYVGLVQAARANNRQGYPVGAAYLLQASDLDEKTLLPDAQLLLTAARARVDADYATARQTRTWALWGFATVILILALLATQRMVTRRTNRLVNVGLAAATLATLVVAAVTSGLIVAGHSGLARSRSKGVSPVDALTSLQTDVLQQRSFESREVIDPLDQMATEAQFVAARADAQRQLKTALGQVNATQRIDLQAATSELASYDAGHGTLVAAVARGDAKTAATYVTDPGGALASVYFFDFTVHALIADDRSTFITEVGSGGTGLGALLIVLPLGLLVTGGLAFRGIDVRLKEYR